MPDGASLVSEAYAARRAGDAAGALRLYREAQAAFGDDLEGRAHCLRHVGDLEREQGRPDAAVAALSDAEALYRGPVRDVLSLANTVRLLALIEGDRSRWAQARTLYAQAAEETGLDLEAALQECDRRLAGGAPTS